MVAIFSNSCAMNSASFLKVNNCCKGVQLNTQISQGSMAIDLSKGGLYSS